MTQQFGPYEVVRKIAVGGMAEIFLAKHRGLEGIERPVILKRILPERSGNPEFETMFLDEARLMAALSHPNIAQVFDLGRADDTYFLVMEYVRGPTLKTLISEKAGGRIPERKALAIAMRVAEALHYLHGLTDEHGRPLGIVHRDLNPANVIVSYDGAVKLIDFGIAKATSTVYQTRTGVIKGTYGYIAPEQFSSELPADHRADVFALGVLLYELVVGVHPFDASDEPSLLDRVLRAAYKRPREVRAEISAELDQIIAGCLAPHPDDRPSTVKAVLSDMVRYMSANGWVVSALEIGALAADRAPDEHGPQPVRRPLSAVETNHGAFGRVFLGQLPALTLPDDAEEDSTAIKKRPAGEVDRSAVDDSAAYQPFPSDNPGEQTLAAPPPSMTLMTKQPDTAQDEGEPTNVEKQYVPSAPASGGSPSSGAGTSAPNGKPHRKKSTSPDTRSSKRPLSRAAWVALSVLVVCAAGASAFYIAQALRAGPVPAAPEPEATTAPETEPATPVTRTLLVVSEPVGAILFVDGVRHEERTPARLTVDRADGEVRLRLVKTGHLPQERTVEASAGEARFVLQRRNRGGRRR